MQSAQVYSQGDKIYDIYKKKYGTIKYLRNDLYEKKMREIDNSHYNYFVDYDDGTFDTYVCVKNLIHSRDALLNSKLNTNYDLIKENNLKILRSGQRFKNSWNKKIGIIKYLRDDESERAIRLTDPSHQYYHVDYDDGSFETYESRDNMVLI